MAIGSKAEAEVALSFGGAGWASADGWEFLGSGISRSAYLAPSGVVYKVQRYGDSCNQKEHLWAKEYRRLHREGHPVIRWANKLVRVPRTALYCGGKVIAMEYFGTDRPEYCSPVYKRAKTATKLLNFTDCHVGNVRVSGKRLALIDLGFEQLTKATLANAEKRLKEDGILV